MPNVPNECVITLVGRCVGGGGGAITCQLGVCYSLIKSINSKFSHKIIESSPKENMTLSLMSMDIVTYHSMGGRVMRWSWVNFQCRGVLQY